MLLWRYRGNHGRETRTMIISLAHGAEKAVEILTAIFGDEFPATGIARMAFRTPVVPVGQDYVMVTYFPMSDIYSIACDPTPAEFFPVPDPSYADLLAEQFSGNGKFERINFFPEYNAEPPF